MERDQNICQIRLDFVHFTISQPNSETACNVDTFQVIGVSNKVPVICGDNHGQVRHGVKEAIIALVRD